MSKDKPEQSAEAYLKESNLVPSYMTEDVMWEVEFDKLCNIMESYKDMCVKKACKNNVCSHCGKKSVS